jgi:hypothetical protein
MARRCRRDGTGSQERKYHLKFTVALYVQFGGRKKSPVHIVSTAINKIIRYRCHAVTITYIRAIRSNFLGVIPAS